MNYVDPDGERYILIRTAGKAIIKGINKVKKVVKSTKGKSRNSSYGSNTVGAAEKYVPKNIKMVDDKYLKNKGINAHKLKEDFVGKKNIAHYDIYVDKDTGMLWIFKKGGKGEGIPTYEYIK